jgi:CTP synthase (UTP-ammonia lyase)
LELNGELSQHRGMKTSPAVPVAGAIPSPVSAVARVALVGDRSADIAAHAYIPEIIRRLREADGLGLDAYWVPTPDAAQPGMLDGFDAVWLVPGSPYADEAGALEAVRVAREGLVPLLATCGGFQHVVVEFARNVAGLRGVAHAEITPDADDLVIVPLACTLKGHEAAVRIERGSLAEWAVGVDRTVERYHCAYGVADNYVDRLRAAGLRFTGVDDAGEVRVLELPGHPFFLATLFQPELGSDGPRVHPVLRAFATAAVSRAAARRAAA